MARIQAGSTLVNQYAPPFVVSDYVDNGWQLVWNSTLQAFEAVDPNANQIVTGFDAINYAIFPNVTQQVFVVDFVPDPTLTTAQKEASFIITINGVKQQDGSYTLIDDQASGTTIVTLSETVANETVEILGLKTSSGARIYRYNATGDGSTTDFQLSWLAPSEASLIVTIDGIKQQVDAYSITSNTTSTQTTLSLSEAPGFNLASVSAIAAGGTGYQAGDVLTVLGGTLRTQMPGTPEVIGPARLLVKSVDGSGAVTSTSIVDPGDYALPLQTGTVSVSGGSGSIVSDATLLDFTPNTITRTGGTSFLTLGFANTQSIVVSSADNLANNTTATITGVTANTITVSGTPFTADTGDSTAIISHSAQFTLTNPDYSGEELEVVGLVVAGETPSSPVQVVNLIGTGYAAKEATTTNSPLVDATDDVRAGWFKEKRFSGDAQLFDFRDIISVAGSNINLAYSDDDNSIYISADVPTFANLGSGQQVIAPVPGTTDPLNFHSMNGGERTTITLAAGELTWDYDPGYVARTTGTNPYVQQVGERIIGITGLAADFGVTLLDPSAASLTAGDTVTIKNQSADTSTITLTPAGGLIDGSGTKAFSGAWSYVTLYTDGTNYFTIAEG